MLLNEATLGFGGNMGMIGRFTNDGSLTLHDVSEGGQKIVRIDYHLYNVTSKASNGGCGPNRPVSQTWDFHEWYLIDEKGNVMSIPDPSTNPPPKPKSPRDYVGGVRMGRQLLD